MTRAHGDIGRRVVGIAIAAYLIAFLLPAWVHHEGGVMHGLSAFFQALFFGGIGGVIAWVANPMMWLALLIHGVGRRFRLTGWWGLPAFLVGVFSTGAAVLGIVGTVLFMADHPAYQPMVGYLVWVTAISAAAVGLVIVSVEQTDDDMPRPNFTGDPGKNDVVPSTQGRTSLLGAARVRLGLVGALVRRPWVRVALVGSILAVTGMALYALNGPRRPDLPGEFTHRPAVHDCGEEFVTSSAYDSAVPALRRCLFEAYRSGRPAEFREKGQYGPNQVYVVTGFETADVWVDDTRSEYGALYHRLGCALEAARLDRPNIVFVPSIDPGTDRFLCATQFRYPHGGDAPIEEPPECTRSSYDQITNPCPMPSGWPPST